MDERVENALITFISSEYLRLRVDLEQGLIERQVRVLEVLVQLFLERLGIGGNRRLADHDLGQAAARLRPAGSSAGCGARPADCRTAYPMGASAVIEVAGWAGSRFITN